MCGFTAKSAAPGRSVSTLLQSINHIVMEDSRRKSLAQMHEEHKEENKEWMSMHMQHWRSWGSWFSWGSPIGLGLFFVLICGGLYILHLAGLVG